MSTPQLDSDKARSQGETQLTQGSLWRVIWVMSWPMMLTTICSSFIGLTDVYVARRLGASAQAAVGLSEQILFLFLVFILSTSVATTAIVSRAFGAKDVDHTIHATAQSISFSVMMGLTLSTICFFVSHFGLTLFHAAPEVEANSIAYLSVYSFYLVPFSFTAIANAAFRAIGDAKKPLMIMGSLTIVNVLGDYLTVVCNWPIPGLGVKGIALSGVVASCFGTLLALFFLRRSILKPFVSKLFPIDVAQIRKIIQIGLPSGLQRLGWALSVFALFFVLKHCDHSTESIASWTIGMRVESVVFMPLLALSLAVSSIVGQNLGAGQVDRAVKAGWHVTNIGIGLMVIMGSGMFFLSHFLAEKMAEDPFTILYTSNYLRINALTEPFLALGMVLAGALQGAGDTKAPMWISLTTHWVIRIPLACLLVLHFQLGPNGAWIAMASSIVLMGSLTVWRYQSKAWLATRV